MTKIILHKTSRQLLDSIKNDPPQSLLLSGQSGIGLYTIATWLAENNIAAVLTPENTKGQSDNQTGTITAEKIRGLYDHTRTKAAATRLVIIDDADRMSASAQSAFLKLLEEPNSSTRFVLTSHYPEKLLTTIRSRVQSATIQPLTIEQSVHLIAFLGVTDRAKQTQLLFIAKGLPAELTRLITDDTYFQNHATITVDARDLLQAEPYKKLLIVQKYKNNRDEALRLLESALRIVRYSLSHKPQQTLVVQLEQLLDIKEKIAANHNIALQLTQFVI